MIQPPSRSDRPRTIGRYCATIGRVGPAEIAASTPRRALPAALAIVAIVAIPLSARPGPDAADRVQLLAERSRIRDAEAATLEAIALRLEQDGQPDQAATVRALIEPIPPADGPRRFEPLPEIVPAPAPSEVAPPVDGPIAEEVAAVRDAAAASYEGLAERAFEAGRLALADASLREVLRRRPDDPEARRLLGYVPHEGGWATPHAVLRLKNGDIFHETYGWIPGAWLPELERGLLPAPSRPGRAVSRWLPAAEADALRQGDINSGWQIFTPHFDIRASVSLDEAIGFARRLEAFHDLFTSLAADVIGPERLPLSQLQRAPGSTALPKPPVQHRVDYFGSKQQYDRYLTALLRDSSIKETLGVYLDDRKVSYFFKDDGGAIATEATLYHEVSHQLLFELAGPSRYRLNAGNFWVFEGLGTYFETVAPQPDGTLRYGGRVGPRIAEARRRIVDQGELVPIEQFVALDRDEFNGHRSVDTHLNYAQAIALAVLLMDHDHASHRDAFLDYAADAYRGRLRSGSAITLSSRLALSYDELDRALPAFLAGTAEADAAADR